MAKRVEWQKVRAFYVGLKSLVKSKAIAATADKFGLTVQGVRKRLNAECWEDDRTNPDVLAMRSEKAARPKLEQKLERKVRARGVEGPVDRLQLVSDAIEGIGIALAAMSYEELRSAAGGANALCKLIELEQKLAPATATELAQSAIAAGISPEEFNRALAEEWRKQA